jgi:hypothetical protein
VADGAQRVRCRIDWRRVIETLIATGEQLVGDVMTGACPTSESRATEEFRVVGMCKNDKDILRRVPDVGG